MDLSTIDWVLLGVLLLSVLLGAWRGLVYEVLSLLAWVVALVLAQLFADQMGALLPLAAAGDDMRYLAGFGVVFLLSLVACMLLIMLLTKLLSAVGLRPIDRVLGALFGLLRGVLLLSAVVLVVGMTPLRQHAAWRASTGVQGLQTAYQTIKPLLPAELARYLPE